MLLSHHSRNQETPWSKQARYLKFKWQERDSSLACKRTVNHLTKLAKWLSYAVSTYLLLAFDCMSLSCHSRDSESIFTLELPGCKGTPCSKQARYFKFNSQQRDSNQQPISSSKNTQPFNQTNQMIVLYWEHFFAKYILNYVIIMPRTVFIMNLYLLEFQGTLSSKQGRYQKFKWQQRDFNQQPLSL